MDSCTDIETLHAVTNETATIFADKVRRSSANSYLRQRSIIGTHLADSWMLGYAPPGWTRLVDTLSNQFPEQALIDAGVARRSSHGTLIDTFRDRVIFGIRASDGQLAGFIGRDLSGGLNVPKYLNTAQSPIFDKGQLLFGLCEGRRSRVSVQPVVVEGPLDVLAIVDRAGLVNTTGLLPVAACGTAFTPHHARLVAEAAGTSPVVVAMDADRAGRSAAVLVGEQLRHIGLDVRVASLPAGSDPTEYLSHPLGDVDTFRYDHALPLLTVQTEQVIAAQGDRMQWIEGRLGAARAITRYLATYPATYAARQVSWLADTLNLDQTTISRELTTAYQQTDTTAASTRNSRQCAPVVTIGH